MKLGRKINFCKPGIFSHKSLTLMLQATKLGSGVYYTMNCEPKTVDRMGDIHIHIARTNYMQAPWILTSLQKWPGNEATRIQTVVHSMATLTWETKCSFGYSDNLRWRIVTREKEEAWNLNIGHFTVWKTVDLFHQTRDVTKKSTQHFKLTTEVNWCSTAT